MRKNNLALLIERVNLWTALLSLIFFFSGFVLMLWAANDAVWSKIPQWKNLVESLGSLLFGTGLITFSWDLFGKRAFTEELLSLVKISQELATAGIIQVVPSFQSQKIDWESLFAQTTNFDLLSISSSTWRNQHFTELEMLAKKPNSRIRVLLPDPNHDHTVTEIAYRMDGQPNDVVNRIKDTINFFESLSKNYPNAQIQVWLIKQAPLFSIYRFNNKVIVAFYSHRRKRIEIPTFICREEGTLFGFFIDEFEAMLDGNNLSTRIIP
ncbi:MAG: hypothetical protein ACK52E_14505 [Aphanizomenon sp.]|jgi:ADP-heptose:LPS heptosyltransferase